MGAGGGKIGSPGGRKVSIRNQFGLLAIRFNLEIKNRGKEITITVEQRYQRSGSWVQSGNNPHSGGRAPHCLGLTSSSIRGHFRPCSINGAKSV